MCLYIYSIEEKKIIFRKIIVHMQVIDFMREIQIINDKYGAIF